MDHLVFIFLVAVTAGQTAGFNNPVLSGPESSRPNVIIVNGTYYMVTNNLETPTDSFPIHSSTDLQNWNFLGYLIPENNYPSWAVYELRSPVLHQYGDIFYLFFDATLKGADTFDYRIGVARSESLTGPFIPQEKPFSLPSRQWQFFPGILKNETHTYLLYASDDGIAAQRITVTKDGVSQYDEEIHMLVIPSATWELDPLIGPNTFHRNNHYYITYTNDGGCVDGRLSAVGVARSQNLLGPYTKLEDPILHAANSDVWGTAYANIVPDLVNHTDAYFVVYGGITQNGFNCAPARVMVKGISWDEENWPSVIEL